MYRPAAASLLPGVIVIALLGTQAFAEIREDPMRPPGYNSTPAAASRAPGWQVREILISDTRRVAVVNDSSVKQGDVVDVAL